MSALPVLAVTVPLALALLLAWPGARRATLALAPWAALPALAAALAPPAPVLEAPMLLLGVRIGLDSTARVFLLFTALLWLAVGASARAYVAADPRRLQFWAFFLSAEGGNLLLVAALDAASFYLGFALMTFAAYGLVVHARTPAAWRAGRVYLVMAVLGEGALLAGLWLAVADAGSIALPLAGGAAASALLFAGFGVKAGVAALHLWLPLAHPVAPTPASAVLSGAMIKAGVLGWLRFLPPGGEAWPVLGATAVALALAAMFGAAAAGLVQRDPKTVLAYSSVSQMGFLTLGVGAGLLAPGAWPALGGAVALYALHHGLAKGALFLGVGAIPERGRARRWALVAMALPALALAGAPWTSGIVAKTGLKAALASLPPPWPALLGVLLPLAAIGTTLVMGRFFVTLAALHGAPRPGLAPPWLAAVAFSAACGVLLVAPAGAAAAWLAAAWPVVAGIALSVVVARWRPLDRNAREPVVPAGDLLVWLAPLAGLAWRALVAAGGWSDRHAAAPFPDRALSQASARIEDRLRSFAVAGSALVLLVAATAAMLWR
jgi:hydrogenase-4 component B